MCAGFFCFEVVLISTGKTPYESLKNLHLKNSRTVARNIRGVFGKLWFLNFLIPLHWWCPKEDDPVYWPNMKIFFRGNLAKEGIHVTKDVTV